MKKITFFVLSCFLTTPIFACTNILVGKNASADGSTMVSYSADSYTLYGELYHWPAADHAKGEMLKVYDWDTNKYLGEIPQVAHTYNVVGNTNENQVTIGETTYGGRPELEDPNGKIDYGSLIYIALQRSKTAREAIQVITDLANKYGYASEGESFSIADPNEIWVMDLIGKGKDDKGIVWVAERIPDDCIAAHANQSRIRQFPLKDSKNCLYAKDVISFAKKKGYFNGKDKDFSFVDAYDPLNFSGQRFCEARVWSIFNHVVKGMDQYLPYAKGETKENPMPLYMKPDHKVTLDDVKAMMRDHFEGTPLDWRKDVGAGPFASPYRWAPLTWKCDSVEYCNERPVATQQTGFTFVSQMRSWLPNPIGGILWFATDDAANSVYTPMYCCSTKVPECYRVGNGDLVHFSWTSSFWIHNWVANMVYNKYSYMHPALEKVQKEIEGKFAKQQTETEAKAMELYKEAPQKAVDYLTDYSGKQAQYAFRKWKSFGEYLIVKYMDGIRRPEVNGKFKTQYGRAVYPDLIGYPDSYRKAVVKETGNKYKVLN